MPSAAVGRPVAQAFGSSARSSVGRSRSLRSRVGLEPRQPSLQSVERQAARALPLLAPPVLPPELGRASAHFVCAEHLARRKINLVDVGGGALALTLPVRHRPRLPRGRWHGTSAVDGIHRHRARTRPHTVLTKFLRRSRAYEIGRVAGSGSRPAHPTGATSSLRAEALHHRAIDATTWRAVLRVAHPPQHAQPAPSSDSGGDPLERRVSRGEHFDVWAGRTGAGRRRGARGRRFARRRLGRRRSGGPGPPRRAPGRLLPTVAPARPATGEAARHEARGED